MPLSSEDYVAICNVLGRYCLAYDANDEDAIAEVFADDGVMVNPEGRWEGTEELRALTRSSDHSRQRRISVPLVVEGDGDSATASSYIVTVEHHGRRFGIASFGTFEDRLERIDGRWRIKFRDIVRPHHDEFDSLSAG